MRTIQILACVFILFNAKAQDHNTCDGSRYRTQLYTDVEIANDIKFGEGKTVAGNDKELFMDIYTPKGDLETHRPLLVLAFGGSFISGKRGDIKGLCENYAKRGFVVVSMDYRLYDLPLIPFPSATDMQTVVVKSVVDMNAALQFLLDDAAAVNSYGIDTNAIFVGGISAGGIMACHTAMLDSSDNIPAYIQNKLRNEGLVTDNANLLGSKQIKGVLNFSGGLHIGDWYDSSDPPVFSYHDDGDRTVPFKKGYAQIFGQNIVELEGSFILDSMATRRGMHSELHVIENSAGHVSYLVLPSQLETVVQESAVFLYKLLCNDLSGLPNTEIGYAVTLEPNPCSSDLTVHTTTAAEIVLLNGMGAELQTYKSTGGDYVINTTQLPQGIYFLRILVNNTVITKKVIKEN